MNIWSGVVILETMITTWARDKTMTAIIAKMMVLFLCRAFFSSERYHST